MTKVHVLLLVVAMVISPLALGQESTMKKGSKAWTDLEAALRDANLEWLCQGKYYKPKRQDCVDSRAKFWSDQFFEINPGAPPETKAEMVAGQTAGAKTYPDVVSG